MPATEAALGTLVRDSGLAEELTASLWATLHTRYSESHRHYHTLEHVGNMLEHLALCENVDDRLALAWAMWFHDAIYDPRSSSNEADSAALFRQLLGDQLSDEILSTVERLILVTEPHSELPEDPAGKLMADLDLLTLGAEPEVYHRYTVAIRKEYAFVPEADFSKGRAQVMEGFLNRERLYLTDTFQYLEVPARTNIQAELARLRA